MFHRVVRTGRSTSTALLTAALLFTVGLTGPALAAEPAHRGVAFVSTDPLSLTTAAPKLAVEVFNGNPERRSLRLSVRGEAASHVTITPPESKVHAPGGVATFDLALGEAPKSQVTGELIAFSSDGTMARAPISVGAGRSGAEDEAAAGYPSKVDYGDVDTGESTAITVANLPGDAAEEVQVGHVSSNGEIVPVKRLGDTLKVGALSEPGAYTGTVDLTPGVEGGSVELAVDAHDGLAWAIVLLLAGLAVAVLSEVVLKRGRPEWALKRRLRDLKALVAGRQDEAAREVGALRPAGDGGAPWGIPRVYAAGDPSSLLEGRATEIRQSLENAASDAQRDQWGPDGAEIKALETDIDTYEALLGRLTGTAREWVRWTRGVAEDHAESPIRSELDERLTKRVIGAGDLADETKASEALKVSLEAMIGFHDRFSALEHVARKAGKDRLAKEAAELRSEVVATYFGEADDDRFTKAFGDLSDAIHGRGAPPAAKTLSVAPSPRTAPSRYAVLGMQRSTAKGDDPAPPPEPLRRKDGVVGWFERNFPLIDLAFLAISLLIVVGSGLSLLYFDDDTFGSLGDEIELLVWGSTASAGIALARRLLPGGIKSLSAE